MGRIKGVNEGNMIDVRRRYFFYGMVHLMRWWATMMKGCLTEDEAKAALASVRAFTTGGRWIKAPQGEPGVSWFKSELIDGVQAALSDDEWFDE